MSPLVYWSAQKFAAYSRRQCIQTRTLYFDRLNRQDAFIIACTHFSHLEPFLLSSMYQRPIRWIARTEMYKIRPFGKLWDYLGAISIRRSSRAVAAVRKSINALQSGDIVGIFPEAGVLHGELAIVRGGKFKHGVSLIAMRARVPILPVIMLGTEKLNGVEGWLPGNQTPLYVGVGEAIFPPVLPTNASIGVRRRARMQLADRVGKAFVSQYQEMLRHFSLNDSKIP